MPFQVKQVGQKTGLVEQETPPGTRAEKENYITSGSKAWASQGEFRAAFCICREETRKAEVRLELTLANVVSDKKKKRPFQVCQQQEGV